MSTKLMRLSQALARAGVAHIVVAGRLPAPIEGREFWDRVVVKPVSVDKWAGLCRAFGIASTPEELDHITGGKYRLCWSNPSRSIRIWTQYDPRWATNNTRGLAGAMSLYVTDKSRYAFGIIRSHLVKISDIPPSRKRATREEMLNRLLEATKSDSEFSVQERKDICEDIGIDYSTLRGKRINSLSDLEALLPKGTK